MSRKRLISPGFFTNADLYDAEAASGLPLRIAFAGLWTVTDRRGVFKWSRNLKPYILPYDPCDVLACLAELERVGLVRSYEVDGRTYGYIPTFAAHQTFHQRERPSTDPAPPDSVLAQVQPEALVSTSTTQSTGLAQVQHRASPEKAVPSPTVTVTGTVTGTASTATTPPPVENPTEGDGPRQSWVADAVAIWAEYVSVMPYGRMGKDLAPLVKQYGPDLVLTALRAFCQWRSLRLGEEKVPGMPTFLRDFRAHVPMNRQHEMRPQAVAS
jgi:hypothetical protein